MSVIHLTSNSRLTQTLKQQALADQACQVIETPSIMTLPQWWQQWEEALLLRGELPLEALQAKLLSAFEAQWLWEQVLEEESAQRLDENGEPLSLLNLPATAKQLDQAWALWMEWLSDEQREQAQSAFYPSDETQLFFSAMQRYQQRLQVQGWQDSVGRQQQRLAWLEMGKGELPQRFQLHGFDEMTPAMQRWQRAVEARGTEVILVNELQAREQSEANKPGEAAPQLYRYDAKDPLDEAQQVAYWCVQQWLQLQEKKPVHAIKIGVVAPNVSECKTALTLALDEQLAIARQQPLNLQQSAMNRLYNFSLGDSLAQQALVQNALLTLQIFLQPRRTLSYADWSQWLISPYSVASLWRRQRADAGLRRLQWASFQWPSLIASEQACRLLPQSLLERLQKWQRSLGARASESLTLPEFVDLAQSCLQALGWCSARELNSDEYQQQQTFQQRLADFAHLSAPHKKQQISQWLNALQRYIGETVHQSQSRGVQPIQIMGFLEAGGQQFDALWVLGLTDEAWPRMPDPNPFLPLELQRQQRLPRCDAQRELEYARQVMQRLHWTAPLQVWSFARHQGEAELLPSPLLESAPLDGAQSYHAHAYQSLAQWHYLQHSESLWELDNRGPEIPAGTRAPGGTGILQAQSQCPLMAFIDYRLGARQELQTVEEGLPSTNQGTLIHEILQHFWEETKTQSRLLAMDETELKQALNSQIEAGFEALQSQFNEHYLQLEQARIFQLLWQWLEVEKNRPSFSVAKTEQEQLVTLAGIEFKLIIDRIDSVAGQTVILDYKTGRASINNLLKTPLKAPQLAVYLHAVSEPVAGIGYGLLHTDDGVKLNALVEEEEVLCSTRSITVFAKLAEKEGPFHQVAWNDFLQALRDEVLQLAQSIQRGEADMRFDKPADVAYAAGKLALRLPEVEAQMAEIGITSEENGG
ncbi:PD-(D/E)XK nuclease family protein [Thiomicrorhabdus sp. zzn3]|uniref:PD-(D/E)XK nuclease family protein n=1 Tax=Thiomicrorhabdus sp. zzn3 TaxID=3039775 RepID=UPI0024370A40|nr:PD-(D/E)XK nuclease family protein [Thiomicrorhabdus sp. zzn3]MDG6778529.1 PD-(D/E)XK nuclease family protein [Thiomicrorhabdus sp. zzn3]